jgi:hypothetical protein
MPRRHIAGENIVEQIAIMRRNAMTDYGSGQVWQ